MENILIHEWFADTARQHPDRLALQGKGATATFRELEEQAGIIQRALSAIGVQKGDVVALATEDRSFLIPAILGVLKQGGIFVPILPFFPDERLQTMLHLIRPRVVVGESAEIGRLRQLLSRFGGESLLVDKTTLITYDEAGEDVYSPGWDGDDCCYIFFTSGSTGQPKPIAGRIKAVDHFIRWEIEECEIAFGSRTSQLISPTFDAFLRDIFVPLCSGGTICLPPMVESSIDANILCAWIEEEEVNVIHCVPTLLRALLNAASKRTLQSVTHLFVSGEVLTPGDVGRWFQCCNGHQARLINLYGPSETTMTKFAYFVKPGDQDLGAIPIGKPIRGAEAILLNQHGRPSPVGAIGEIYIRTDYRSLGYYGKPDLSKEAFIANPFRNDPNDLLYRTGDIGRILEDGNYEFLGRNDSQIKLRGIRIELSEIEAAIRSCPQIQDCVVVALEAPSGEKNLCAYYVSSAQVNSVDLRDFIGHRLPEYMRPAAYVELTKLPLLPNGKVDRSQLPAPQQWLQVGHLPPASTVEEILCGIWEEVLRLEKVGVEDSFFELGGHSLMATQVISRVRHVFNCEVSLRAFLQQPTIRKLAHEVEQQTQDPTLKMVTPISVVSGREQGLPLSFAQQRLWFLAQLEPESRVYHVPFGVRLKGELNVGAVERSMREIVRRHEVLRTRFPERGGVAVQEIGDGEEMRVEVVEVGGEGGEEVEERREERVREMAREEWGKGFDLGRGPLLRVKLLRLGEREHVLLVTMHHVVSDGWSVGVMSREFTALYNAYSRGEESPLGELGVQYADFAVWQREWLQGEVLEEQLGYWRKQLEGLEVLELTTDHGRGRGGDRRGGRVRVRYERRRVEQWKGLSRREGVTLFMTMLGGMQAVMGRYAGQRDIAVGSDVANRNRLETEGLIGFFVNQLVLRSRLGEKESFQEVLRKVREVSLGAYAHQDLPFERLVEELSPEREMGRMPLFQVKLVLQNAPGAELRMTGVEMEELEAEGQEAELDLLLMLGEEEEGGLAGVLKYAAGLFRAETMERLVGHLGNLLDGAAEEAARSWEELSLMSVAEEEEILAWGRGEEGGKLVKNVVELVERQVALQPDRVAVSFGQHHVSYRELNDRAGCLARYLRSVGIGAEVLVGLCTERSIEMVVGMLGVLKAGGAYVPLDPGYPAERLAYMLEDAQTPLLLTQEHLRERLPTHWAQVVCLDSEWNQIEKESGKEQDLKIDPQSLAYVIYTSGSTGRPNGTLISHEGLEHSTAARLAYYQEAGEAFLLLPSFAFDSSVAGIYGALSSGGRLVLPAEGVQRDVAEIAEIICREQITQVLTLGSLYGLLLEHEEKRGWLASLKVVTVAGEACQGVMVKQHGRRMGRGVELHNEYGPTEATVWSTVYQCTEADGESRVPIGRPIRNTKVYVLDEKGEIVPMGVAGELYIGGAGVARGYLNRPELTGERFVPDAQSGEKGGRLYRTGDKVRWRLDGNLEYLGRVDQQVKIRGYRIELEEIEGVLREQAGVQEAVVIAREDRAGQRRLVAYVVLAEGKVKGGGKGDSLQEGAEVEAGELGAMLRTHLAGRLPEYMVPSAYVRLERIPLTPNGKVDRKALPEGEAYAQRTYEPPQGEMEEVLANLWQELLGVERVGRHDNFFELGGHSLLAVRMLSHLLSNFNVQIELSTLFNYPQLSLFAKRVLITSIEQEFDSIEFQNLVSSEE